MIRIVKSDDRGKSNIDWLNSRFSFSFAEFYDERMMHFGPLRVLNDDYIAPGGGFPMHPHKDMEIITYVVEGGLRHADSMGSSEVIGVNQIQKMSAGRGIYHSEFNASTTERVHLYQTWIIPSKRGLKPSYKMKSFTREEKTNKLYKIASPDGSDDSIVVVQDAYMYVSRLTNGTTIPYALGNDRGIYLHVISGKLQVSGNTIVDGDALLIEEESGIEIKADEDTEIILFDVAMHFVY